MLSKRIFINNDFIFLLLYGFLDLIVVTVVVCKGTIGVVVRLEERVCLIFINHSLEAFLKILSIEVVDTWAAVRTLDILLFEFCHLWFGQAHVFEAWLNFFKFKQIWPCFSLKFGSFWVLRTHHYCRFCKIHINFWELLLVWNFLYQLVFWINIQTWRFVLGLVCFRAKIHFCILPSNIDGLRWLVNLINWSLLRSFLNNDNFWARKFFTLVSHVGVIATFFLNLCFHRSAWFFLFLSDLSLVLVPCCFPCYRFEHLRLKPTSMHLHILLQFLFQLVVILNCLH